MMDDILKAFRVETAELLNMITDELLRYESGEEGAVNELFRAFHTIKGSCSIVGMERGEGFAHSVETRLDRIRNGAPTDGNVITALFAARDLLERIIGKGDADEEEEAEVLGGIDTALAEAAGRTGDGGPRGADGKAIEQSSPRANAAAVKRKRGETGGRNGEKIPARTDDPLDAFVKVPEYKMQAILSLVSELVVAVSNLNQEIRDGGESLALITSLTGRMYRAVLDTNMIPASEIMERHYRTISDISRSTGKKIRLVLEGGDVEIDKLVAEKLSEPVLHLIRNAADHGIESPGERSAVGKDPEGTVRMSVRQDAGFMMIEIADDGRGVDPAAIREKAEIFGMLGRDESVPDSRLFEFLFTPGFTLSSEVTKYSGRGVGMDAVKQSLASLRGTVIFDSRPGTGSLVTIRLPVSLSLVEGFIATVNGFRIIVSYENVRTCVEIDRSAVTRGENGVRGTVVLEGRIYPVIDLVRFFPGESEERDRSIAVILSSGKGDFVVLVDEVNETANVMIRNINKRILDVRGIAGFATLGNGSVVMVLDPAALMEA